MYAIRKIRENIICINKNKEKTLSLSLHDTVNALLLMINVVETPEEIPYA